MSTDDTARKLIFVAVLALGSLSLIDALQLNTHANRIKALEDKMTQTNNAQVTWKAIINYGGGYRVIDETGKEVADGLNSYHVIREAIAKGHGKSIRFEYFSEESTGLEPTESFGPKTIGGDTML